MNTRTSIAAFQLYDSILFEVTILKTSFQTTIAPVTVIKRNIYSHFSYCGEKNLIGIKESVIVSKNNLFCKLGTEGFNEKKYLQATHFVIFIKLQSKTRTRKRVSKTLQFDKKNK